MRGHTVGFGRWRHLPVASKYAPRYSLTACASFRMRSFLVTREAGEARR